MSFRNFLPALTLVVGIVLGTIGARSIPVEGESRLPAHTVSSGHDFAPETEHSSQLATSQAPPSNETNSGYDVWRSFEKNQDHEQLMMALNEMGFPPQIVMVIMRWSVSSRVAEEYAHLFPRRSDKWWENTPPTEARTAELVEMQNKIERELAELAKGMPHPPLTEQEMDRLRLVYGDIPPEKVGAIRVIEMDYDELRSSKLAGLDSKARLQAQRDLELSRLQDLKDALTPEEYDQYMARNSNASQLVRDKLSGMQLSESDFLAVADLYVEWDEKTMFTDLTFEEKAIVEGDFRSSQNELINQLGEDRFFRYVESMDPHFGRMNRFVQQNELPPQTERRIWEVKSNYDRQLASALKTNQPSSVIEGLRNEAISGLQSSLGVEVATQVMESRYSWSWFPSPPDDRP